MMKKHLVLIAVLLLTVIAYWPALKAGFMYDDRFFIQENPKIREWRYVSEYFTDSAHSIASIFWDGIWRPLRTVSYLVDYKVWGLEPFGFHLTSLLWHLLNVALLILLLDLLFQRPRLSLAAGLIFALHPAQAEAVTWISSRGDLMYVAFGLAMFIFYRKYVQTGKKPYLFLSLSSFLPALLSKETAVAMPALVVFYDWLFGGQGRLKAVAAGWKRYAPYFILILAYLALRRLALGRVSQCPYWGDSLWTTILTMSRAALEYVRLLFLPLWLRVDYVYDLSTTLLDWRVLGSLAILGGISLLAWRDAQRSRFLTFGWLWLAIGLLPVSNLLPLTAIMAERFLYLPLAGFAVWAGNVLSGIGRRGLFLAALLALALPMSWLTVRRNIEWQDPERFWRTEVGRSPGSYIAHGYLGNLLYLRNEHQLAEAEFRKAIEIDPTYEHSLSGLALVCAQEGRYQEAVEYARRCLEQNPRYAEAYSTIGICFASLGQRDSAERYFKEAVRYGPKNEKNWINLGIIYEQRGEWKAAIGSLRQAAKLAPNDFSLFNDLGVLWTKEGRMEEAIESWRQALSINPGHLPARMNLALALEEADSHEAIRQWTLVLQYSGEQGEPINQDFIKRRMAELDERSSR